MPSSGTKSTGFASSDLGPFKCSNCQKYDRGVCTDAEVSRDHQVPDRDSRREANGVRVKPDECCNEFLSLNDIQKVKKKENPRLAEVFSGL